MKILMVCTKVNGGMLTLARNLKKSNQNIIFIPAHREGIFIFRCLFFVMSLFKIIYYLAKKDTRILHQHISERNSLVRNRIIQFFCILFKKKNVLHAHGAEFFSTYNKIPLFKRQCSDNLFHNTDALICQSDRMKKEYSKFIDPQKIHVIPNFTYSNIETSFNSIPQIVFSGNVGSRKGIADLITACSIIRGLKFSLIVAGDGNTRYYQNMAKKYGLSEIIRFTGWLEEKEMREIFACSDIFVLPSYYEVMPMSILESMATGLPIITTSIATIPDIVTHEFNGYLIQPGDIESLTRYLRTLIINPNLRKEMGKNSKIIFEKRFSDEIVIPRFNELYNKI